MKMVYCMQEHQQNSIDVYRVDEGILTLIDNHKCNELKNIKSLKFVDNISSREEILFVCADNGIGYYNNIGDFVKLNTGNFNSSIDNMTYDYHGKSLVCIIATGDFKAQ